MPDSIEIVPSGPVRGTVRPPGSKSITNRALVCAALAAGQSRLAGALRSDDTVVMIEGLRQLGIDVAADGSGREIEVTGCDGQPPATAAELFVGNSGTTARFLTALATLGSGAYRIHGVPRMHQRPISDLLDALRALGADVASEAGDGCPPVIVRAAGLEGGRVTIRGDVSSQFLSGLLLSAPCAREPVEIVVDGPLVSKPYVQMTLSVMSEFGMVVGGADEFDRFFVPCGLGYHGNDYAIEPDASAASYFFAAAAVTGGQVTVSGLSRDSLQGDVAFCDCLARMGCRVRYKSDRITVAGGPLKGIEIDMADISDTAQTLAAVALFAEGPTTITGIAHVRHKETDRIAALATELRKLGATVEEQPSGLRIVPGPLHGARVDTYDDHRMAMSLALVGLAVPGVAINDPGCTAKTYPDFFHDLDAIRTPAG